MDEDIAFLRRLQLYVPIATWNLCAACLSAIFLSSGLQYRWLAALTGVIAVAGDYVWFRRRAAHKGGLLRFLNLEVLQIIGCTICILWFATLSIVDKQPRLLIVCGVSGLLLAFRLKVRADKQARLRQKIDSPQ